MMSRKKILIISTGGTFNKIYDPIEGELVVDDTSLALKSIASKWLCEFEIINILGKDSLHMDHRDRAELLATIDQSVYYDIIVIHGTDTMDGTAEYLAEKNIGIPEFGAQLIKKRIENFSITLTPEKAYNVFDLIFDEDLTITE
jgi:hypothetical protein